MSENMKKYILYLMIFLPFFVSCQKNWQTVNYNGVSLQIPTDWGSKYTVNHFDEDITEYQISCWSKEEGISLIIQWVDVEFDGDLYIKSMIETQKERFPVFREIELSKIVDADFLNMKAKKCHFSKYFDYDDAFEGEYIAFTKDKCSYIVLIGGDKKFYKSDTYNTILYSIKPNFSSIVKTQEKVVQSYDTDDNFIRYEFNEYCISVPNTMELRNENSYMSLGKEIINDKLKSLRKIDTNDYNFVFQPSGCDDVMNIDRQKKALDLYARILISYQKGENGDYMKWNDNTLLSKTEYNEINNSFKNNLLSQYKQMKQMKIEILNIEDIKVGKNSEKFVYIKQSYARKGLNGDVKVTDYYLFNYNEMVKLTVSYRISESNLWDKDFDKILDTFSFNFKNR
ncbi:MAG: hypothetical protein Q7I99_03785 [Acholeplasmataceae bacterium]|nr:hypothetical protein [Acholeplasmataceae bacterium]